MAGIFVLGLPTAVAIEQRGSVSADFKVGFFRAVAVPPSAVLCRAHLPVRVAPPALESLAEALEVVGSSSPPTVR